MRGKGITRAADDLVGTTRMAALLHM
jgi:hypothetical protein